MPSEADVLESMDFTKLPPPPDYPKLQGPMFEQNVVADIASPEIEKLETDGDFPHPIAADHGTEEATPKEVSGHPQGEADVPELQRPRALSLPGFTVSRSPDGALIAGFVLTQNVPLQIVTGRAGLKEADVFNIGSATHGFNPCYITSDLTEAEQIANGADPINGLLLPVMDPANGGLSTPFKHECEAPLYAVCTVSGGTLLQVYNRYYRVLSKLGAARHNGHRLNEENEQEKGF